MTPTPQHHAHGVVVGHDGSPAADGALEWAVREALASGHRLTLAVVAEAPVVHAPGGVVRPVASTRERTASHDAMERVEVRHPDLELTVLELEGHVVTRLAEVAHDAALLVVGSRGAGAVRAVPTGQVGSRLARVAPCPMVVVPHHRAGVVRRGVLAGVSVRRDGAEVLDRAYAHADAHGLPLTILHATRDTLHAPESARQRWLAEAISGYGALYPGVHVRTRIETGRPTRTLLHLSEPMDLLVVGRHTVGEDNPWGHVRGSIVDRAPCPVMVVPPAAPRTDLS